MTPIEKARHLYLRFYNQVHSHNTAKQCAIMASDELIQYLPSSAGNPPNIQESIYNYEFWESVKQEINKL